MPTHAAPSAPSQPTSIRATTDGRALTLQWLDDSPGGDPGTIYNVRRRIAGQPSFTFVGAVGTRKFSDTSIPAGAGSVQYTIYAQRGLISGPPSSLFSVRFTTGSNGLTITSQFSDSAPETEDATQAKNAA